MSSSTERVLVGRIGKPHGLAGEVVVRPESDDPRRFSPGSRMQAGARELEVESSKESGDVVLVRFVGISDRNAAEELRDTHLTVTDDDRRDLGDDEFWPDELVGLQVRLPSGEMVGSVTGFLPGDAQDRLVLQVGACEVEIPFVGEIVPQVEVDHGFLVVDPPAGLLDG